MLYWNWFALGPPPFAISRYEIPTVWIQSTHSRSAIKVYCSLEKVFGSYDDSTLLSVKRMSLIWCLAGEVEEEVASVGVGLTLDGGWGAWPFPRLPLTEKQTNCWNEKMTVIVWFLKKSLISKYKKKAIHTEPSYRDENQRFCISQTSWWISQCFQWQKDF